MLEFSDRENISWLLKKRDQFDVSSRMESEETSRKRKNQDSLADDEFMKRSEAHNPSSSFFDQKRRRLGEDSKNNTEEGYKHQHMRLDLELNLSPSLIDLNLHHDHDLSNSNKNYIEDENRKKKKMSLELQTRKSMSWVAFELEDDDGRNRGGGGGRSGGGSEGEMVARVCIKCHMLVMLCKASPVCPNCKFMHSPEDTSLSLLFTPKPTNLLA